MSAILSADDLNDFISPGVACIKPIETLPAAPAPNPDNPYEVTTEDKVAAANPAPPATISLTDCLACSGCVTSAEAVLVSLQSHGEVLSALDRWRSVDGVGGLGQHATAAQNGANGDGENTAQRKMFVATVSPQVRASIAATFGVSLRQAGNMITQLLSGESGLASGGKNGSRFTWVLDTDVFREIALVAAAEEVAALLQDPERKVEGDGSAITDRPKKPILTSACPGWICYAEKTHPHILPHLSRLKSPQALAGIMVKSVLAKRFGVDPANVWHLAVMPCFDKKLEASRSELTSAIWANNEQSQDPVRDVDCVITARELISLAASRGFDFAHLSRKPLPSHLRTPFPDPTIDAFLSSLRQKSHTKEDASAAGTSGGYLWHILRRLQAQHPGSTITTTRGRNADVVEYTLHPADTDARPIVRFARYYGFRNIQNLVRKLKPTKTSRLLAAAGARGGGVGRRPNGARAGGAGDVEYAYVEVMACPGGCTNGGGQIRAGELESLRRGLGLPEELKRVGPAETREWLTSVDETYYSASSESQESEEDEMDVDMVDSPLEGQLEQQESDVVDGISRNRILSVLAHWADLTGVGVEDLTCTSYRRVESDVGKKVSDVERVAGLASTLGGGW